jgi:hypothetical protein
MKKLLQVILPMIAFTMVCGNLMAARPSNLHATPNPVQLGGSIRLSAVVGPHETVQFFVKGRPVGTRIRADRSGRVAYNFVPYRSIIPMRAKCAPVNWTVKNTSDRNLAANSQFIVCK